MDGKEKQKADDDDTRQILCERLYEQPMIHNRQMTTNHPTPEALDEAIPCVAPAFYPGRVKICSEKWPETGTNPSK